MKDATRAKNKCSFLYCSLKMIDANHEVYKYLISKRFALFLIHLDTFIYNK